MLDQQVIHKINNNNYSFFDKGDSQQVFRIDGEKLLLKKSTDPGMDVLWADTFINKSEEYDAFIPVYYKDGNDYITAMADPLSTDELYNVEYFCKLYLEYLRENMDKWNVFDFVNDGAKDAPADIVKFVKRLEPQVKKLYDIHHVEYTHEYMEIDFRPRNVMKYNGNFVMIDW